MIVKGSNRSLFLSLIFGLFQVVAAFRPTNETDYQALLAFKNHVTSDPSDVLSSWNNSVHFCAWSGVRCGKMHQRVTALELLSLGFVGTLSPHIGNLTFLRVLHLDGNGLKGIIPQEIGRLLRLETLSLVNNSFTGELPWNLTGCKELTILSLGGNNLVGRIPDELGSLLKLVQLELPDNHFTGKIPSSLGNLSALSLLFICGNYLEGSIPMELGQVSNLERLQLSSNSLSGNIPTSLYNISSILMFSVGGNNLSGSVPSDVFITLTRLQGLYLTGNRFSGPIPTSLTNASRLVEISISNNSFMGPIPSDLGGLVNLQYLDFEVNPLGTEEGDDFRFLVSLFSCNELQEVWLSQTRLKGRLPDSIGNFSINLTTLALGKNLISGKMPSWIGDLVRLERLSLDNNMFVGTIPDSFGKLSNLQSFSINNNNISGMIPSSIGNMTSLSYIYLRDNMLEGVIPISIGKCTHLTAVDLSQNQLIGPVPEQLFGVSSLSIVLAGNYLTDPIPSRVGRLVNLQTLDVSDNNMSGEIPPALGSCVVLETLSLDGNRFNGTIPSALKNLRGLRLLDVSQNNLSGQIPEFLASLPFIENLNLSFNKFEGEVPHGKIFGNLSAASVAGNRKLCGGPPTLQLPTCEGANQEKDRKRWLSRRRSLAIGVSVSIFILLTGVIITMILCRSKRSKRRTDVASLTVDHHPKLSYAELLQATDGFSPTNMIGEGSFGVVYKGVLPRNEQVVAVKVLKLGERGASKSFMAECEALKNIRHRNLVKNITSCSTIDFQGEDFKALVFDFMLNGSLEKWLHPISDDSTALGLLQRLNIAIDVATALDYLHHCCHNPIVHCDLKPSNVLLDSDFSAHVSDFGLAKFLMAKASGTQSSSIGVRGTIGYVAPEYGIGGEVSTWGDVHSFGILLLELFTGKRPTDPIFGGSFGLREFVERSIPQGLSLVIDPILLCSVETYNNLHECLVSILGVGLTCSAARPNERMGIQEAAVKLQRIRENLRVVRTRNRVPHTRYI
ncbi:probable LRR receptor-like serine/threonine-protein kinase At3g47570 [Punica granatum]|uniref:non-specific serine/threonine protein kinase n=2 Tax=Punica granatum TaxID=22663 RepID=A0A218XVJ0_PUNGR|nr:probable LRR receptor-like serine/threonine-protein kinase At3g47570 [Punica granatum]OWM88983.1 hypothetical protein CDL15_Pgr024001 [Punica granatum]PKI76063.1 hypothetical protein CRG98_003535 [Punica granatum]